MFISNLYILYNTVAWEGGTSYQYDRFVNTCYSLKEVRRTWYQAQSHCQAEKGWLLDLSDQKKAEKLMKKFNNYHFPCMSLLKLSGYCDLMLLFYVRCLSS